jgi:hypothetical protein
MHLLSGDHGGDPFTCLQVNCTHEGCNQNTAPNGSIAAKETHDLLKIRPFLT